MNVKWESLAFRIWQFANPKEWDVTYSEVANGIGISYQEVSMIARAKGWEDRFRDTRKEHSGSPHYSEFGQ